MKWFIPREHGAWAMLIVPFLLGMFASQVMWQHFIFFIGVLSFYFASAPLFAYIRKPKLKKEAMPSFLIYITIGSLFTAPSLYLNPKIIAMGLLILPFFLLNIVFAKQKKERLFFNDLSAIIALSFLALISYFIGSGTINAYVLLLMIINILFFTASVFHVKTLIREKGNKIFLWKSHVFHALSVILFLMLSMPFIALLFLISALKAWLTPKEKYYKPIQIGLIEIANSVLFVIGVGVFY